MKEKFAVAVTGSSYLGCHQKAHQRNQDRREAHLQVGMVVSPAVAEEDRV